MSYIRGLLTRAQMKILMEPLKPVLTTAAAGAPSASATPAAAPAARAGIASAGSQNRPAIAPAVPQFFLP
jgi:hypothetical protein